MICGERNNELSQTLAELCDDLFSVSECNDHATAILLSLATLASGFPRAQKTIGRLLAQRRAGIMGSISSASYMSMFAQRFLYKPSTSKAALGLLAIVSYRNVRNQTRIVQEVAGVRILRHQSNKSPDLVLYTLTIPSAVKQTYKAWKQRHRALANLRIPCGQPPTHDGIPMPCYCNSCLSADQFLPTWQQHFNDLSQWANDSTNQELISFVPSTRSFSSAAFYSLYLQSYQMFTYCPPEESGSSFCHAVLYYFAPESDSDPVQPPFDPLRHLSAIEITEEVDIPVQTSRSKPGKHIDMTTAQTDNEDDVPLESVTLLETQTPLRLCRYAIVRDKDKEADRAETKSATFLESIELEQGECVTQRHLIDRMISLSEQLSTLEAQILRHVLAFCGSEDLISVSTLHALLGTLSSLSSDEDSVSETNQTTSEQESDPQTEDIREDMIYDATVIAQVQAGQLVIQCVDQSDSSEQLQFKAVIHQQDVLADSDKLSLQENQFALLHIDQSVLLSILSHCVVCQCPQVHEVAKPNVLLRKKLIEESATAAVIVSTAEPLKETTTPLPGLSIELQQQLQLAGTTLEREESITTETVYRFLDSMTAIIRKCNERITFLASAPSRAMKTIPNAHRSAAMIRCQLCRDHLIRLSKTLKIQQRSDYSLVPLKRAARMKALVLQTLQSVFQQSQRVEVWEIPDERVAKLHLNRQLWASGFPDAAFYQQSERVTRENRRQQRRLNARLQSVKGSRI